MTIDPVTPERGSVRSSTGNEKPLEMVERCRKIFPGLILVALLSSCTGEPGAVSIQGEWRCPQHEFEKGLHGDAVLILQSRGEFTATDVPKDFFAGYHGVLRAETSGSGHWSVSGGSSYRVTLNFERLANEACNFDRELFWHNDLGSPRLLAFLGDPDDFHRFAFKHK